MSVKFWLLSTVASNVSQNSFHLILSPLNVGISSCGSLIALEWKFECWAKLSCWIWFCIWFIPSPGKLSGEEVCGGASISYRVCWKHSKSPQQSRAVSITELSESINCSWSSIPSRDILSLTLSSFPINSFILLIQVFTLWENALISTSLKSWSIRSLPFAASFSRRFLYKVLFLLMYGKTDILYCYR